MMAISSIAVLAVFGIMYPVVAAKHTRAAGVLADITPSTQHPIFVPANDLNEPIRHHGVYGVTRTHSVHFTEPNILVEVPYVRAIANTATHLYLAHDSDSDTATLTSYDHRGNQLNSHIVRDTPPDSIDLFPLDTFLVFTVTTAKQTHFYTTGPQLDAPELRWTLENPNEQAPCVLQWKTSHIILCAGAATAVIHLYSATEVPWQYPSSYRGDSDMEVACSYTNLAVVTDTGVLVRVAITEEPEWEILLISWPITSKEERIYRILKAPGRSLSLIPVDGDTFVLSDEKDAIVFIVDSYGAIEIDYQQYIAHADTPCRRGPHDNDLTQIIKGTLRTFAWVPATHS